MIDDKIKYSLLLDYYGPYLNCKSQKIMELYFEDDYSLSEIAELYSMTRQGVSESIKKSRKKIEKIENDLHFVKRFTYLTKEIGVCANMLKNNNDCNSKKVVELLNEIINIC